MARTRPSRTDFPKTEPRPRRRLPIDGRSRIAMAAAGAAGAPGTLTGRAGPWRLPYSARKTSSSEGSRLTKSTSAACAASRTTGATGPLTSIRMVRPSTARLLTPGTAAYGRRIDRLREPELHLVGCQLAQRFDRIEPDDPAVADDRDAVAGALDLADDVRGEEHGPTLGLGLEEQLVERLLDERIEARGRLVEDRGARAGAGGRRSGRPSACCPREYSRNRREVSSPRRSTSCPL